MECLLLREDWHRCCLQGTAKRAADLAGFDWALAHNYGVLVEIDAEDSHDRAELPELLAALETVVVCRRT